MTLVIALKMLATELCPPRTQCEKEGTIEAVKKNHEKQAWPHCKQSHDGGKEAESPNTNVVKIKVNDGFILKNFPIIAKTSK